jgi:hypothetical protein
MAGRKSWVQINGKLIPKDEYYVSSGHAAVLPDLPDFVSPIDGKVYHGRAGLREHCRLHDVVPTADLRGLPPKLAQTPYVVDRAAIREKLIQEVNKRWTR